MWKFHKHWIDFKQLLTKPVIKNREKHWSLFPDGYTRIGGIY